MSFRHRPLMTSVYEWHCSHACASALVMGRIRFYLEFCLQLCVDHKNVVIPEALRFPVKSAPVKSAPNQIGPKSNRPPKNENKKRINK
jgi:hypothetical protein